MRILTTSDIFPPDIGGPATYVPRVASELTKRGHHVHVVTYSAAKYYAGDNAFPFPITRIPVSLPRCQRLPRTVTTIMKHGGHADIIFANGLATETVLANAYLKKPIVAKVVGDLAWERSRNKGWIDDEIDDFQTKRYGLRVTIMRWRRDWTYRRMHHIVVPSQYLRDMLIQAWKLPPGRVSVIYNSYEPATGDVSPVKLSLTTKHKIITVCRLTSWKGVDGLIALLPSLPDVGLVVIGDGPLHSELAEQARHLRVEDRVLFAGTVPRASVSAYLQSCDVFALNSKYEGLPHVILEAMTAGLPVVATDAGGTAEVMQGYSYGTLVPKEDLNALRTAITSWMGRPRDWVPALPDRFSQDHMLKQTEALLARFAQARPQ